MEKEQNVFARSIEILQTLKEMKDPAGLIEFKLEEPDFSFYVKFPDSTAEAEKDIKVAEQ